MSEKKADKTYPSQFEKVKEITDRLEAGIQALFDSDAYKNYLKTLSKFHDYSLNNTILIVYHQSMVYTGSVLSFYFSFSSSE